MALWLVRAGRSGEYESKFLTEGRVYLTWDNLSNDLSALSVRDKLIEQLNSDYPENKIGRIRNWASQIWPFAKDMNIGDWVILPSKKKAAVHIGEITGKYVNNSSAENPFYHHRSVKWFATDIPRSNFDQDILYSLGASVRN